MTENNLKAMPLTALQALKGAIDDRIVELERERRAAALKAARETALAHGFELETLLPLQLSGPLPGFGSAKKPVLGASSPKKGASIGSARYAKPGDPSVTWTGRGRRPNWFIEHMGAGRTLAELEIH